MSIIYDHRAIKKELERLAGAPKCINCARPVLIKGTVCQDCTRAYVKSLNQPVSFAQRLKRGAVSEDDGA